MPLHLLCRLETISNIAWMRISVPRLLNLIAPLIDWFLIHFIRYLHYLASLGIYPHIVCPAGYTITIIILLLASACVVVLSTCAPNFRVGSHCAAIFTEWLVGWLGFLPRVVPLFALDAAYIRGLLLLFQFIGQTSLLLSPPPNKQGCFRCSTQHNGHQ